MAENVKSNLAKAARILLVFALVFWGSFRVEALAYAQLADPVGVDVEDVEEGELLTDLAVYEVDPKPDDKNKTGLGELLAVASDEGELTVALTFEKPGEERQVVAIPAWNGGDPSIDEKSGRVQIANFVKWSVEGEKAAEIEADEKTPGIATVRGMAAGVVTVTCSLDGEAQDKLELDKFPADGDKPKAAAFNVEIGEEKTSEGGSDVDPVVSRRVSELKISDADGTLVTGTGVALVLPQSQVGKPYAFQTEIKVRVLTGEVESFEPSADSYYTLAKAREAGVDVTWSLAAGSEIAEIDQDGVLTFNEEGAVSVNVEATIDGAMTPADFEVKIEGSSEPVPGGDEPTPGEEPGEEPQPVVQGDSNPQEMLTVVSNARVSVDGGEGEGGSQEAGESSQADGESGSSSAGADGSSESGSSSSSAQSESGSSSSSAQSESGSSSSSAQSESSEVEASQSGTFEKSYSISDLEALGTGRATYTMYDGGDFVTVTGEGPYLIALLQDIGIENTDQVESLTFETADGNSSTIAWSELESANRYYPKAYEGNFEETETVSPIIAIRSLVRGLGDGTGEGADAVSASPATEDPAEGSGSASEVADGAAHEQGSESGESSSSAASGSSSSSGESSTSASSSSSSEPDSEANAGVELLDNTRYRLLFGSTSPARAVADPNALRYINKISVNVKPAEEEPEDPGYDTDIAVSVEYVPVPMGAPAVFSALPNTAIRDARFDFNWEVSTDDGKTWNQVENGNVQVLRVITTEERIGNKYRVVMSTDASDKGGRENVIVTSDPVTMTEGNGLAVVLEYDPPIAGQTAYFQTTLYGAKKDVKINYTWQQSQDGGVTWSDIAGRTGSSLAVPTEPIDPNAEKADDDEVVPITYVRVIAEEASGDKRVAISEAVPLTVHVGDDDSGPADTPKPEGGNEDKPSTTPDPDVPVPAPAKPPQQVKPIDNIVPEPPEDRETTPTVPMPDGSLTEQVDPSELFINEEVTDIVHEQQEAVEEYIEANVPGARWTSLSTAQATDDDVRNILADNPFAPFVFPVGLGITVAGGLEKFLAFRRQVTR